MNKQIKTDTDKLELQVNPFLQVLSGAVLAFILPGTWKTISTVEVKIPSPVHVAPHRSSVLDGRGEANAFAELFYGGAAATLARWPNKAADGSTVYAYTLGGVCGGSKVRGGCQGGMTSPPCSLGCGGSLAKQCSSGCTGIIWRSARLSDVGAPPAVAHKWAAAPALGAPLLHGFWTHEWRDVYVPITVRSCLTNCYSSHSTSIHS